MALKVFQDAAERMTGRTAVYLRDTSLEVSRRDEEEKRGSPLKFVAAYPWIGRGTVLWDCLRSRQEVDAAFDEAIQQLPDAP